MASRAQDWFRQAEQDLEQAKESQQSGRHEWACFAAQQAAEKAVKALHLSLGQEAWGHVVAKLILDLPESVPVPGNLKEKGQVLDNFYDFSQDPNSIPEGAPFEHFRPQHSSPALHCADSIVDFARTQMSQR